MTKTFTRYEYRGKKALFNISPDLCKDADSVLKSARPR